VVERVDRTSGAAWVMRLIRELMRYYVESCYKEEDKVKDRPIVR
jgi:hypothetical protein